MLDQAHHNLQAQRYRELFPSLRSRTAASFLLTEARQVLLCIRHIQWYLFMDAKLTWRNLTSAVSWPRTGRSAGCRPGGLHSTRSRDHMFGMCSRARHSSCAQLCSGSSGPKLRPDVQCAPRRKRVAGRTTYTHMRACMCIYSVRREVPVPSPGDYEPQACAAFASCVGHPWPLQV